MRTTYARIHERYEGNDRDRESIPALYKRLIESINRDSRLSTSQKTRKLRAVKEMLGDGSPRRLSLDEFVRGLPSF